MKNCNCKGACHCSDKGKSNNNWGQKSAHNQEKAAHTQGHTHEGHSKSSGHVETGHSKAEHKTEHAAKHGHDKNNNNKKW